MQRLPRGTRMAIALATAMSLLLVIFGCNATSVINTNLSRDCINGECLTFTTWGQNIDAAINKQAAGYGYIIMNHGLEVAHNTFGQARTAADAPATALTADMRANIASVTKTMTAVAALKLLAAKHVSVNSPMYTYLPQSWQLGQNVKSITFAELLTHTSGIRDTQSPDTTYASLQVTMAQDIALADKVNNYQNADFALFRLLIPYLNGFNDAGVNDIAAATDQAYLAYMNSVYGNDFPISCNSASSTPVVLSYPYPAGSTHGVDWGDWTDLCGGGGLQLSLNQMGIFLAHLMLGTYLPTSASGPLETSLPTMVSQMYGWDYSWPTTHGTCVAKNGDLGFGNAPFIPYLSTLYVYCPDTGLGFVGFANSTLPATATHSYGYPGALDDIVYQAYNASWQPAA